MSRPLRIYIFVAVVSALIPLMLVHPLSLPRRNQKFILGLLKNTTPVLEGGSVSIVKLPGNVVLKPGEPKIISGYRLELRVGGSTYYVDAEPLDKSTGFLSFQVDEEGVVREALAAKK